MKLGLSECIDVTRVQRLTDLLYGACGIPMAVVDLKGTVLVKSGWQDLCAHFHRINPRTRDRCVESDTRIANRIEAGKKYTIYRCRNGLFDAAIPINIEGEHAGNFFAGQFFFEGPDMQFFRDQALRFGFEEAPYMRAVAAVPIMDEARLRPFLDYLSEFTELLGTGLNQLEQRSTIEAFRRSEGLLHAVIEATTDHIYAKDLESRYLLFNTAAARAAGKDPAEVIGKDPRFLFPSDEADWLMDKDKTLIGAARVITAEETVTGASGEKRTFLATKGPLVDDKGAVFGLFGISRDITERIRAEEALRESEEKFRVLFEESKDAIIIATLEGRVTEVNRAFLDLLGYTGQEAVGLALEDICFDPRQRENLAKEISGTGGVKDFGLLLKKRDGTTAECLITASGWCGRSGAPVGYQGIIRDVTEQRRLEREILQVSAIERQEIGQDLHDNLGQHMLGIALKAKSLALSLKKRSMAEAGEAEKLTDLVNQAIGRVRDVSKGMVPIDFEAGGICRAIGELADRICNICSIPCRAFFSSDGTETGKMTAMQVYRIAQEAVVNAARHSAAKKIEIHLIQERGATTLRVEDDGVGIAGSAAKDKGLGLRLMKYRAESINGSLEVRDRAEGGTVVECVVRENDVLPRSPYLLR